MKILVPTDFSKYSQVAVHYAAKLAIVFKAELILLNVLFVESTPRAQAVLKSNQILEAREKLIEQDFKKLIASVRRRAGRDLNISWKISRGFPVESVVESSVKSDKIDLVVMGTKGASGLKKVLMGSVAAAVIAKSSVPVLAVPGHTKFEGVGQILYASDLSTVVNEFRQVVEWAAIMKSTVNILHVADSSTAKKINKEAIKQKLISKFNYPKIKVHMAGGEDVNDVIDEYIGLLKADMLVMFAGKHTFFRKIFGLSHTREMAFHSWVPLLALRKK